MRRSIAVQVAVTVLSAMILNVHYVLAWMGHHPGWHSLTRWPHTPGGMAWALLSLPLSGVVGYFAGRGPARRDVRLSRAEQRTAGIVAAAEDARKWAADQARP